MIIVRGRKVKSIVILVSVAVLLPSIVFGEWVQSNGIYGDPVSSFAVSGEYVFAGTPWVGVFLSTDSGIS